MKNKTKFYIWHCILFAFIGGMLRVCEIEASDIRLWIFILGTSIIKEINDHYAEYNSSREE